MIQKFSMIQNEHIIVCFNHTLDTIIIQRHYGDKAKLFSGFDGLKESFETFAECINEEVSFEDAIKFFTPSIGKTFVG